MAQITIKELISLIEDHPKYFSKWRSGTSAGASLYIRFSPASDIQVTSEIYEVLDGSELILDLSPERKVVGIEIF